MLKVLKVLKVLNVLNASNTLKTLNALKTLTAISVVVLTGCRFPRDGVKMSTGLNLSGWPPNSDSVAACTPRWVMLPPEGGL